MRSKEMLEAERQRQVANRLAKDYIHKAKYEQDPQWREFYVDQATKQLMIGSHAGRIG